MFRSLWLAVFGWFIAAKSSPTRWALIWGFVEVRPTLRTANTSVNERASKQSNRAKEKTKSKAAHCIFSLTCNECACDDGCEPRANAIAIHHAHPLSTHISSRIGPATRQARRSRAILRDGFMRIMVGNVCCYFKPNHSANYRQFNFFAA